MADGMGGLIASLMTGNPMGQLNQALAGPQPGAGAPQPAPGGGTPPGAAAAPLAPPQATQSPADLAQLYLKLERSQQLGDSLNRHMALMAGGFKGPPGGAQTIMQGMTGGGQQDPGAMLQNLLMMRQQQNIMNMPAPPNVNPALWASMDPATRAKVAGDIVTQQAGIGGPPVMQEMNRGKLIYMKQHGITDPNDPSIPDKYIYPDKYEAAGTAEGKQAGDVQEFKDNAVQDFGTVDEKLNKSLTSVNQLLGDKSHTMDDTMTALTTFKPTTGKMAANMPSLGGLNPLAVSQSVKDQAAAINTLKGELSAEAMTGVKNIRNQREFAAITASLTAALDPANSPDKIQTALQNIRTSFSEPAPLQRLLQDISLLGNWLDNSVQTRRPSSIQAVPITMGRRWKAQPKDDNTRIKIYNPKTGEIE